MDRKIVCNCGFQEETNPEGHSPICPVRHIGAPKWIASQLTPRRYVVGHPGGPGQFYIVLPTGTEPDKLFHEDAARVIDALNAADKHADLLHADLLAWLGDYHPALLAAWERGPRQPDPDPECPECRHPAHHFDDCTGTVRWDGENMDVPCECGP